MIYFYSFAITVVVVAFGWYIFNLIGLLKDINEDNEEMEKRVSEFLDHIKMVGTMNLYSEDPILKNLIVHTKDMSNYLINYQISMGMYDEEEIEELQNSLELVEEGEDVVE